MHSVKIAHVATDDKIFKGRTRLTMKEVISKYPYGVQIVEIGVLTNSATGKYYPVFVTDADECLYDAPVLTAICIQWLCCCGADVQTVNDVLAACGGVLIEFTWYKSRGNKVRAKCHHVVGRSKKAAMREVLRQHSVVTHQPDVRWMLDADYITTH